MSTLIETFKEEAFELIQELEDALLELEENPANAGLIDRVFRALHTLKGSGGLAGFEAVAGFCHEAETVFELVRSGERKAQPEGPPDAFALFCAYHLGITPSDGYQNPQLEEIARRFSMSPKEIRQLLGEFQLDDESIRGSDFDLEGAKLDIRLAPEGISRTEVA